MPQHQYQDSDPPRSLMVPLLRSSDPDSGPPALDAAVEGITDMTIRGAAKIGRTAAAALARVARESPDEGLRETLLDAGRRLVAARPTAVSLRNAVNMTLDGLREATPGAMREAVGRRAADYAHASETASVHIARQVADLVPKGATVLTHCHSTLAVGCIIEAHRRHGNVRVFADETRPWWQGHITVRMLADAGVDVTLQVDSAAHATMQEEPVDVVIVGADTVVADGSLYNKIGTRAVALGAHELGIPFYVAAEAVKFSPYSLHGDHPVIEKRPEREVADPHDLPGVHIHNPVFDRTAPELITRYITEHGPVDPMGVAGFIRTHFPDMEDWI